MSSLFHVLRPRQWLKNLFCLAGVVFAGKAADLALFGQAWLAVVAFCAASSAVYILNDIVDRERDAIHPVKCRRPIASGALGVNAAMGFAVGVFAFAVALSAYLGVTVLAIVAAYLVINVAYSIGLKHVVIVDVITVALGFILRILAGAEAVAVPVSAWILLCTFFLALFLGFAKRRGELHTMQSDRGSTRGVLRQYDAASLDTFTTMCATLAIATYALFTTSDGHERSLVITCPPVAFAIFQYLHRCRQGGGESTDAILLQDRAIQFAIAAWIGLYVWVLYGGLRLNLQ